MSGIPRMAATSLVSDHAYRVLEQAIFSGELPSGSPLRVREMADLAGTSAMPVRDAIRRLEEAGLAVRTPHKGSVVRDFTIAELIDIYSVRTILEKEGARLGAMRVTAADVRAMWSTLKEMDAAVADARVSDALDADEELLRTLYTAGGNDALVREIETLWRQCRPYKVFGASVAIRNGDQSLWDPQPKILAAAIDRDTDLAVQITEESLLAARRRLEALDRLNR